MEFEWDEAKRVANLAKHRIDFRQAQDLFDGRPFREIRSPYAEEARWIRTGVIDGIFITAVWTVRAATVRLISARIARHGERRAYRELHDG